MSKFELYLLEVNDQVENIKKYLIDEYVCEDWEDFIIQQNIGDCQNICHDVTSKFPDFKTVMGEIEIDHPYKDGRGKEQYKMQHYWNINNNKIYDFSKGTLSDYVDWDDINSVIPNEETYRYKKGKIK